MNKYQYVSGSAMREVEIMLKRLLEFAKFAELDRSDDLHLPLTSAQSLDLDDAINHLERFLNPV